jgi:hypothetical protein
MRAHNYSYQNPPETLISSRLFISERLLDRTMLGLGRRTFFQEARDYDRGGNTDIQVLFIDI